jgi:hypothetical protein
LWDWLFFISSTVASPCLYHIRLSLLSLNQCNIIHHGLPRIKTQLFVYSIQLSNREPAEIGSAIYVISQKIRVSSLVTLALSIIWCNARKPPCISPITNVLILCINLDYKKQQYCFLIYKIKEKSWEVRIFINFYFKNN